MLHSARPLPSQSEDSAQQSYKAGVSIRFWVVRNSWKFMICSYLTDGSRNFAGETHLKELWCSCWRRHDVNLIKNPYMITSLFKKTTSFLAFSPTKHIQNDLWSCTPLTTIGCSLGAFTPRLPSLKLTFRPWKLVVGRRSFLFGSRPPFSGIKMNISFKKRNLKINIHLVSTSYHFTISSFNLHLVLPQIFSPLWSAGGEGKQIEEQLLASVCLDQSWGW